MRKLLLTVTACLILAPAASASPIIECGNYSAWMNVGSPGVRPVIWNITTRNVSCRDARSFANYLWHHYLPYHSGWIRIPGWRTYYGTVHNLGTPWGYGGPHKYDLRATRTNHVIRFQYLDDYC